MKRLLQSCDSVTLSAQFNSNVIMSYQMKALFKLQKKYVGSIDQFLQFKILWLGNVILLVATFPKTMKFYIRYATVALQLLKCVYTDIV